MNPDYSSSREVHLSMNSQQLYVTSQYSGTGGQKQPASARNNSQKTNKRRQILFSFY